DKSPCTHRPRTGVREKCAARNAATAGPARRTTAIAELLGGVRRMAKLAAELVIERDDGASRLVLDVVFREGEGDAIERQVGGDGVDELPGLEQLRGVAASGDDVGPGAQLGGVVLDEV